MRACAAGPRELGRPRQAAPAELVAAAAARSPGSSDRVARTTRDRRGSAYSAAFRAHLAQPGDLGRDHRRPGAHRLERGQPEPLVQARVDQRDRATRRARSAGSVGVAARPARPAPRRAAEPASTSGSGLRERALGSAGRPRSASGGSCAARRRRRTGGARRRRAPRPRPRLLARPVRRHDDPLGRHPPQLADVGGGRLAHADDGAGGPRRGAVGQMRVGAERARRTARAAARTRGRGR